MPYDSPRNPKVHSEKNGYGIPVREKTASGRPAIGLDRYYEGGLFDSLPPRFAYSYFTLERSTLHIVR